MSSKIKPLAVGVVCITALLLFATLRTPASVASVEADQPTLLVQAETNGTLTVAGLGVVEAADGDIDLAPMMPGVIAVLHAKEGGRIKKGDVLAELVNDDLKALVAQAEATLAMKTAEQDRLTNGARPQEIAQAEDKLRERDELLKFLQTQYDRRVKLGKTGAVSREAVDEASNALVAAQVGRDSAASDLSLLLEGARDEDIAAAKAGVDFAARKLDEARAVLAKSYIRATSDATVLRLYKDVGEAVSTQPVSPIAQIADTTRLVVRAQIDEADIAAIELGQSAEIAAPALRGERLKGKVARISPRIGAKTVSSDSPAEKRDARVLDVIISLDAGTKLPVALRVDVFIDTTGVGSVGSIPKMGENFAQWSLKN